MAGPDDQQLLSPDVQALETKNRSPKKHKVMFPVVRNKCYSWFFVSVITSKVKKRGAEEEREAPVKKKGKSK